MIAVITDRDDRDSYVRALNVQERDDLNRVVRFLIHECDGTELIKLRISRRLQTPVTPHARTCMVLPEWVSEFGRVAAVSNDCVTFRYLVTKKLALYKEC